MISWIQRSFQQHFKWLFLVLLAVVIVSFVFITNASTGLGQTGVRPAPDRPFFGINLSKLEDGRALIEDAQLSLFLRRAPFEQEPGPGQVEEYALQRHAALHHATLLGLPTPDESSPEVLDYIRGLGRFSGQNGRFDPQAYASFIDSLDTNPRLSQADVGRVILDDVRVRAYEKLIAGPGYVTAADLSDELARRNTRWTLAIATIDGAAFSPNIDVSEAALQTWFETNARRYEVGPRVSVAAIRFPASRFADQVTVTDERVRAAFDANPARYPAPAGTNAPEIKIDPATGQDTNADQTFAAVRGLVEADLRKEQSERAALMAADDLLVKMAEQRIEPARLPEFLAAQNLALEEIGAIGNDTLPPALAGAADALAIGQEALRLAPERPYSNPVSIPDGAAILVFREAIAPRVPLLSEVKDRVLVDYQAAEKRRLFNESGRGLRSAIAAAVVAGKPFEEAVNGAAAAAGLKAEIKKPAPFTLGQPPATDFDFSALQALGNLDAGGVSDLIPSRADSALIVHAIAKDTPAFDPASPDAREIKEQFAPILAQRNAQSVLAALVEAELAKSAPAPTAD
jgi:peptidyl-prolyl cis-trans isomerase D